MREFTQAEKDLARLVGHVCGFVNGTITADELLDKALEVFTNNFEAEEAECIEKIIRKEDNQY